MVKPDDEHNRALVRHVHPHDWVSPTPAERYGLVVIGGGPAGLVAAIGGAGLGARVALVERSLLGGDCLNWGCVPSKALLASAHAAHVARRGAAWGVHTDVRVDFGEVMARMRKLRAAISHHDSAERLRNAGVDVFLGEARFTGPDAVEVNGQTLRFSRAVIATGARAAIPPIPGLSEAPWLDNERLFELTELPPRLVVIGGGPIGAEMAQAFARLGSAVTLVDQAPRVLPREEPEAGELVAASLRADGVRLETGVQVRAMERGADGWELVAARGDAALRVPFDHVLVAVGRRPNTEGLGLEAAGVKAGPRGVEVDAWLRTSSPRVYAAGDVASRYQFTHAADAQARVLLQNALFLPTKRADGLVIPWATYTDPEVGHVGPTWDELQGRTDLTELKASFADNDRAVCDGQTEGYARAWVDPGGKIVAATIVGPHAGDLINEVAVAMTHGLGISALGSTIHAYPTRSEIVRRLADAWNRRRLTPGRASLLRRFLGWRLGQKG